MEINIVCRDHKDGQGILPRLARTLAKETGWGLSGTPNGLVDITYFNSYIEYGERYSDWRETRTAAYFTHFEDTSYREFWWNLAAEQIELRIVTAPMYGEMLGEPFALCRPPIDPSFQIQKQEIHPKPVVGMSGFVRARISNRKGAKLVARLAGDDLGQRIRLIASGHGWPIPTTEREPKDLPNFYNTLDVLLCTSLIEGIPMPPLEALACGIKVVIPRKVGLLDSLPDIPGIYRYKRGDYDDMNRVLEQACFSEPVDREVLRAAVSEYTPHNWAEDHRRAFENMLYNLPKMEIESDRHGRRGMYCVAYGEQARNCAKHMMGSFREHMPKDIEIALASDSKIGPEDHLIKVKDVDVGGRHAKTRIYDEVPEHWQYIMYLDADTEVVADVSWLYKPLFDGWDMVICTNPGKFHITRRMLRTDNKDECDFTFKQIGTDELIQLNGGVFVFQRNTRTAAFFRSWHEEWQKWGKRDQAALLRALWKNPLKLYVLSNVWNAITRYCADPDSYTAGIKHYPLTARRWRGMIKGRSDSKEAWKKVKEFKGKE